jgi:probable rRNA maturation factor
MSEPQIEVRIEDPAWTCALPDAEALTLRAAERALVAAEEKAAGEIAILLTQDAALAALNHDFRRREGPTNVLSFPSALGAGGDIALAYGVCAQEAATQGKSMAHHLQHLTAHGVLHLLGFDHETPKEAEVMEALERRIMEGLGAPDPYAADD